MCQLITCAKCCSIFSFIGFVFLLIIGVLLQKQPLYVKGTTDPAAAAKSCYYAALIYAGFVIISVAYWMFHDSVVAGRNFLSSRGSGGLPDKGGKIATSTPPEAVKFGSKYGAVSN